ncbi:hypothetical protein AX774_g1739 [Zancudomyces culisetae]|uniref:Uncharacterized protein n=1 Tax=Zancudomyces culisetae TaxID=1213189 RepID=A0A1R1PUU7_ZANCU|nr:hypothetical protein AX774_g1739 [Zancudomyces culisetae]|eukprot:OMH84731.1 hypothetical protein AX774_g1739 [Zancudomyces culisetae]
MYSNFNSQEDSYDSIKNSVRLRPRYSTSNFDLDIRTNDTSKNFAFAAATKNAPERNSEHNYKEKHTKTFYPVNNDGYEPEKDSDADICMCDKCIESFSESFIRVFPQSNRGRRFISEEKYLSKYGISDHGWHPKYDINSKHNTKNWELRVFIPKSNGVKVDLYFSSGTKKLVIYGECEYHCNLKDFNWSSCCHICNCSLSLLMPFMLSIETPEYLDYSKRPPDCISPNCCQHINSDDIFKTPIEVDITIDTRSASSSPDIPLAYFLLGAVLLILIVVYLVDSFIKFIMRNFGVSFMGMYNYIMTPTCTTIKLDNPASVAA